MSAPARFRMYSSFRARDGKELAHHDAVIDEGESNKGRTSEMKGAYIAAPDATAVSMGPLGGMEQREYDDEGERADVKTEDSKGS